MLARFICPASRLEELLSWVDGEEPWRVSVLLRAPGERPWLSEMQDGLDLARSFAEQAQKAARLELVEAALPAGGAGEQAPAVRAFLQLLEGSGLGAAPFLEVALGEGWERELPPALEALAQAGSGAKLRCGGPTSASFPSPRQVAAFISTCQGLGVPLKATAGLHHPFRHTDPRTGFTHHGFLNVVGAAVLAHGLQPDVEELTSLVADEEAGHFALSADGFLWQDLKVDGQAIGRARRDFLISYGSCSFHEPVEDLLELGLLPPS